MYKYHWLPVTISLVILFCLNTLMVSSLSPSQSLRQLLSWLIGCFALFIGTKINPKQIASSKNLVFIISCGLLLLPIILNNITRGSRRWIDIGFTSFQPSEMVKPWLMLFLVNSNYPLLILIPVSIIMLQPDLGSAVSILLLIIPIILYNKNLLKIGIIILLLLIIASPVIWNYGFHQYQRDRVTNFINPNTDPLGKGYNVIQSKIAIGSGGFWGKGYKKGTQAQLLFLPEKHTDFMFAATSEELGLTGIGLMLFAHYLLIKSLINKAFSISHNRQLFLFTLGISFQIWAQTFINIGMNLGLMPVTGIPLPFMSVGGSSIIALMFSIGIIFSY